MLSRVRSSPLPRDCERNCATNARRETDKVPLLFLPAQTLNLISGSTTTCHPIYPSPPFTTSLVALQRFVCALLQSPK